MRNKDFLNVAIRYLLLVLVAIPNLYLFYTIFTPLTIYPVYFLLKIFFNVSLNFNTLSINNFLIHIIPACIAGSAYYLLLILNLSIPKIDLKKRLKIIGFAFLSLLILNIIRIFILISISLYNLELFNITHKIFWYLVSIIFVVGIWFIEVKIFRIKEIPFYSDMKNLYKYSKN
jgi:exosortase/archaeosortase family protein